MAKTQKELAFIRDLYVADDWTRRFTDLIDKNLDVSGAENILYINAGTGNHAFALREKASDDTAIFATCEDEDLLNIAREKAAVIRSDIDFSMLRFDDNAFDAVIADASFARPGDLADLIDEAVRAARTGARVGVLTVSSGSFGEVFSLLWEVLFNEDLGRQSVAEDLVAEIPTATKIEEIADSAGLGNITTHTSSELFEYDNGREFIESPLVADFLLPAWLETMDEDQKEEVSEKVAQLIDAEDGTLSFRFSVKATLVAGEKR
jgi:ubiquinone/menaquinone biosynthesis C-methylase UbiE